MATPMRKSPPSSRELGEQCLAQAMPNWRNEPRLALAAALENAPAELAADLALAAALAEVNSLIPGAGDERTATALFAAALEIEAMGRELDAWHRARVARWERRR